MAAPARSRPAAVVGGGANVGVGGGDAKAVAAPYGARSRFCVHCRKSDGWAVATDSAVGVGALEASGGWFKPSAHVRKSLLACSTPWPSVSSDGGAGGCSFACRL